MKNRLIEQLIKEGYLKSPRIIEAFKKVRRADFVRGEDIDFADGYNAPLSIGFGQTISQPLTVAFMLELLQPEKGDRVLDVGSGSGWQTALLCQIVGKDGFVYAVERIPELKEFGENNIKKYNFKNVEFICGDGSAGLSGKAPFDKIVAAAAADEIPLAWKKQLKTGGRLVAPVKNSIWLLVKRGRGEFEEEEHPGFVFVPLIKE